MKSSIFSAVGDFFAVDVGSSAIRVVQLKGSGSNFSLVRFDVTPIDVKTALSDSLEDQQTVAKMIKDLSAKAGITTKNIAVGLPSNKTFVTVVDLPKMSQQELNSTLKYQADQYIPMSSEDAKTDSVVLGDSINDPTKMEVLIASVANKFSEQRLDVLESVGFNVVALEPETIALTRALGEDLGSSQAQMIVDMGEYSTDIVVTLSGAPRLVRSIPTGANALVKSVKQAMSIDDAQAKQFLYKFGLDKTKLDGQIYNAVLSTAEVIATEIQKSVKFFITRYPDAQIAQITTSGVASTIPGFAQFVMAESGGIQVKYGNAWQKVSYPNSVHEKLMEFNNQFAVAIGLGMGRF